MWHSRPGVQKNCGSQAQPRLCGFGGRAAIYGGVDGKTNPIVPQGRLIVARRFNGGKERQKDSFLAAAGPRVAAGAARKARAIYHWNPTFLASKTQKDGAPGVFFIIKTKLFTVEI